MAVETKLFAYPVGFCKRRIEKGSSWSGPASYRFKHWWHELLEYDPDAPQNDY
jgi:hypothetical protein